MDFSCETHLSASKGDPAWDWWSLEITGGLHQRTSHTWLLVQYMFLFDTSVFSGVDFICGAEHARRKDVSHTFCWYCRYHDQCHDIQASCSSWCRSISGHASHFLFLVHLIQTSAAMQTQRWCQVQRLWLVGFMMSWELMFQEFQVPWLKGHEQSAKTSTLTSISTITLTLDIYSYNTRKDILLKLLEVRGFAGSDSDVCSILPFFHPVAWQDYSGKFHIFNSARESQIEGSKAAMLETCAIYDRYLIIPGQLSFSL